MVSAQSCDDLLETNFLGDKVKTPEPVRALPFSPLEMQISQMPLAILLIPD